MTQGQVVRLSQDVAGACDVVGLTIAEHMPWDTLAMRNMLRQLPLLAGIRRQIILDHGRVQIDLPRLRTDDQLADVLEAFVKDVKGRGTTEPADKPPEPPSNLPPIPKMTKRRKYCCHLDQNSAPGGRNDRNTAAWWR
jgi:hypothetical protein